jgi:hypothetical protein
MRRLLLVVALGLLLATGCAEKKHLEALEKAWTELPGESASTAERIGALQAFLVQYPADHKYGNPHEHEARTKLTALQLELKAERDRDAAAARAQAGRAQLRGLVEQHFFSLLAEVDHAFESSFSLLLNHPTPPVEVEAAHEGARARTRHRLTAPAPYVRPSKDIAEELARAAGKELVDEKTRAVDVETLKTVLDLAWLDPDDELLGVKARQIYPYFAPWLREQLFTMRAITEAGMGALRKERAAFLARSGQEDDPTPDLVAYYQHLVDKSGPLGVVWPSLDQEGAWVDVGFWLRRDADGSYQTLAAFLDRVAKAYDPALMKELESGKPVAQMAPTPETPPPAERAWTPAPITGDMLLPAAPIGVSSVSRRAAAWRADGQVLALQDGDERVRLFDVKTGEARELALPNGRSRNRPARMVFSASGDLLVAALDAAREPERLAAGEIAEVVLWDVRAGVIGDRFPWPGHEDIWQVAIAPDGAGVGAADFLGAAWFPRGAVDAGPDGVVRLPGAWAIDVDPTGRFVITGGAELTISALPSGEKIASYNGLRGVGSVAFSPDGRRVIAASRDGDRAHLLHFDEKNKALVRDAALGENITRAAWLDDGSVLLFSDSMRRAAAWNLDDRSHEVAVIGDDLLAVDRAYRRVLLDTRTDDVVLYSLSP